MNGKHEEVKPFISESAIQDLVNEQAALIYSHFQDHERTSVTLIPVLTGAIIFAGDLIRALSRMNPPEWQSAHRLATRLHRHWQLRRSAGQFRDIVSLQGPEIASTRQGRGGC